MPYQAFETKDGRLVLAVGNDGQFARLCEVVGRPELARDPRFATNAARVEHRGELVRELAPLLAARATGAWLDALDAAGVPCGPINDLAQVFEDPQVRHRGLRIEVPHSALRDGPGGRLAHPAVGDAGPSRDGAAARSESTRARCSSSSSG